MLVVLTFVHLPLNFLHLDMVGDMVGELSGVSVGVGGFSVLPLSLLSRLVGPLGGGGGLSSRGGPLITSTVPVAGSSSGGTGEARSGSVPVTTGLLEARLDGGGALLLNTRELLLLDLLLSLGLRVAVCA